MYVARRVNYQKQCKNLSYLGSEKKTYICSIGAEGQNGYCNTTRPIGLQSVRAKGRKVG